MPSALRLSKLKIETEMQKLRVPMGFGRFLHFVVVGGWLANKGAGTGDKHTAFLHHPPSISKTSPYQKQPSATATACIRSLENDHTSEMFHMRKGDWKQMGELS